jgi:hypothetical protein
MLKAERKDNRYDREKMGKQHVEISRGMKWRVRRLYTDCNVTIDEDCVMGFFCTFSNSAATSFPVGLNPADFLIGNSRFGALTDRH